MNNAIEQYPGQLQALVEKVEELEGIMKGERVVVPTSIEHAKSMIKVAEMYLQRYNREITIQLEPEDEHND